MAEAPLPPLPCTVLTGFLGAGKTTLLNHLLTTARGVRIGALVNEFGAVDIDTSLIVSERAISTGVVELSNGCICCTINESLCEAVSELLARRTELDHLLIETTGVADPQPVLDTLRLPRFAFALRVDAIVTVVDATSVSRRMAGASALAGPAASLSSSEMADDPDCVRLQLAAADLLVVNKSDLVSTDELRRVRATLSDAAPHARQLQCQHGKVAPEVLLSVSTGDGSLRADADASEGGGYRANYSTGGSRHAHAPSWAQRPPKASAHLATDGFVSVSFRSPRPLNLVPFERLRRSAGWSAVVRAKGFLAFVESAGHRVVLQQCGRRVDVRTSPCDEGEEGGCTLVLIGQPPAMQPEVLLQQLHDCVARTRTSSNVVDAAPSTEPCLPCEETQCGETASADDSAPIAGDAGTSSRGLAEAIATERGGGSGTCPSPSPDDAAALAKLGEDFAACMRRDQRFEIECLEAGGALVRFRLMGWFSVAGDALTAELRDSFNLNGQGVTWLAPCRVKPSAGATHTLVLVQALCLNGIADEARVRWTEVQKAAEAVMMAHLGEMVCGGCDCLDTLAGKVLT